jgi:hypothetical protein
MEEPSVLDYLKAKLSFGRIRLPETSWKDAPEISDEGETTSETETTSALMPEPAAAPISATGFPWRTGFAFVLAIIAQILLEPPGRSVTLAVVLYVVAATWLMYALKIGEWAIAAQKEDVPQPMTMESRQRYFWLVVPFILVSFFMFSGNRFTTINLFLWGAAVFLTFFALWIPSRQPGEISWYNRIRAHFGSADLTIRITPWSMTLFAAVLLVIFFRFYWLDHVPGEMFSDHAEKLLDVSDVLSGQTAIFFTRNTGREAFQMYLTAAIARVFDTGLSFMS